jgi:hypothetical protein
MFSSWNRYYYLKIFAKNGEKIGEFDSKILAEEIILTLVFKKAAIFC